jgi:hypothetical protein
MPVKQNEQDRRHDDGDAGDPSDRSGGVPFNDYRVFIVHLVTSIGIVVVLPSTQKSSLLRIAPQRFRSFRCGADCKFRTC